MSLISRLGNILKGNGSKVAAAAGDSSARSVAKERLSVILASQRQSDLLQGVDMVALQKDVLEVVQRHIARVAQNRPVDMGLKAEGDVSFFEMSIELETKPTSEK